MSRRATVTKSMNPDGGGSQLNVVIAGGGVAALEAAMALRAHAKPDQISITLASPESSFVYQPLTVNEPFARGRTKTVPLEQVAGDVKATFVQDGLESVDVDAHTASFT